MESQFDAARMKSYMVSHPDLMPDHLQVARLVNHPNALSATWRLEQWRSRLQAMIAEAPDDPDWPRYLACVEQALIWRATVPPDYRSWFSDRR